MKARAWILAVAFLASLASCSDDEDAACSAPDCMSNNSPSSADGGAGGSSGGGALDAAQSGGSADGGVVQRDAAVSGGSDAGPPRADASASADASAPVEGGPAQRSAGCGAAQPPPPSGTYMIDVSGTARQYIIALPANYDAGKPYRLVFAWHGLGGTAAQIARGYYGLQQRSAGSAIFVSGQGLETAAGGAGWQNSGGQDVAFVRALYAQLAGQYCVDETRVFSVGMSYGGIMSNTLGCQMGDVFRAIAPMSGSGPGFGGRGAACMGQVAAWMSHGNTDTVVAFSQGQASRDTWARNNHCQMTTAPVEPSPCVAYQGCDPGHPVTWCEFDGGHTIPPFASAAIWTFFSQF
jgi:polyhydroxybutyrate depolymerase